MVSRRARAKRRGDGGLSGVERQSGGANGNGGDGGGAVAFRAYVPLNAELKRALGVKSNHLRVGNAYRSAEAAARAHDRAMLALHGFGGAAAAAALNFPPADYAAERRAAPWTGECEAGGGCVKAGCCLCDALCADTNHNTRFRLECNCIHQLALNHYPTNDHHHHGTLTHRRRARRLL